MKRLVVFFIFYMLCSFSTTEYKLVHSIPFQHVSYFTTDNLGNAYVVTGNQLLLFDKLGKPKYNYSERNLGELRLVDASNPMKVLLFYPDFGRIDLLTSTLSLQSTINLRAIGISQAMLVCTSPIEGFWVLDQQDYQLKKVGLDLQVSGQSSEILKWVSGRFQPNYLLAADDFVYLNNPETGILVFDRYGTYFKTIPITGLTSFQIKGNELLYLSKGELRAYHLKTLSDREIKLPDTAAPLETRIEQDELYLLTTDSLNFYSF